MTVEQAVRALRVGDVVRMTVGANPDDPVLLLWADEGCVESAAIAGWSAGVREAVCALDSDFLTNYLCGALELARKEELEPWL